MTLEERQGVILLFEHKSDLRVQGKANQRALDALLRYLARHVIADDQRRATPRKPYRRSKL